MYSLCPAALEAFGWGLGAMTGVDAFGASCGPAETLAQKIACILVAVVGCVSCSCARARARATRRADEAVLCTGVTPSARGRGG